MIRRDAISLTPFWAFGIPEGGAVARSKSVQSSPCRDAHPRDLFEQA